MKEVFLGFPGQWADNNLEAADHYTSKIGGLPDWPFPESFLGDDLLKCSSCTSDLFLISQVYAPVSIESVKIAERVIFVFGCTNTSCRSWRAIRIQKPDNSEERKTAASSEVDTSVVSAASDSKSKWWDDLYSFGSDGEDSGDTACMSMEELSRAFSETAVVSSGSAEKNTKKHVETKEKSVSSNHKTRQVDARGTVLPCFYIYSEEDKSFKDAKSVSSSYSAKENLDYEVDVDQVQEAWDEEGYEYDKALNTDRTYLKFKKRIDSSPEQCFRYSFEGKPILATGDVGDPGFCAFCGGARCYEMQLMPQLVYFLQEKATTAHKNLLENWSWLTLLVYSCSKSCFQNLKHNTPEWHGWTVAEEIVIAQCD